jgi:diaminopropionate ammonia-lyase
MLQHNTSARRERYDESLRDILNIQAADESRAWLSTWDGLNAGSTPLWDLPDLAARLGVGSISVKDEGHLPAWQLQGAGGTDCADPFDSTSLA